MNDIATERRRNGILLSVNVAVLIGVLGLLIFGRRGPIDWLLLLGATLNVASALSARRALSR